MMVFTCVYYHWILGKKLYHVLTQSHHFPWKKKKNIRYEARVEAPSRQVAVRRSDQFPDDMGERIPS